MINLLCTFRRDDHPIPLNQEFHQDLTWWRELFQSWDGLSFFLMPAWAPLPDFQVSSDAAGSLGFGVIFNSQWFFGEWAVSQQPRSMAYKELFPIVVAAHLWGSQWSTWRVEFLCDNESVVAVLSSSTSRDADLMVLLRYLALLAVRHSFSFKASSVHGKANLVVDSLSRFQLLRFRHLSPHAAETPMPIPPALLLLGCLRSGSFGGCGWVATSPHCSGLSNPEVLSAWWAGLVAGLRVGQAYGSMGV